ncbi:hypothetical protein NVV93_10990 [Pseudomonas sp. LS44]|uniref:hypothetical protein n=1 Tax=Pseudomonas sp. LS44 TaxID=1357074 RepID=UPI00215B53D4|nr:hypothetical protein [Pseudomonas sp. LS44]UVE16159.1 hypothetical protein NVV93_10990 [Pseudomonas sp. LS44]
MQTAAAFIQTIPGRHFRVDQLSPQPKAAGGERQQPDESAAVIEKHSRELVKAEVEQNKQALAVCKQARQHHSRSVSYRALQAVVHC